MPKIVLPILHQGQVDALSMPGRLKSIRCGRRWGKTALFITVASSVTLRGGFVGWLTPDYKIQQEAWRDTVNILNPVIASANKSEKVIELITGGRIEYWTLDNDRAGRSRKYHYVFGDEIAFAPGNVKETWERSIEPTLIDFGGSAMLGSTPNGNNPSNFFWQTQNKPEEGWSAYHAPSWDNPHIKPSEIERFRQTRAKPVFDQEFGAEFVDWSTAALFTESQFLVNGEPVAFPAVCSYVFAVIDTTAKGGYGRDGTAATFFAYNSNPMPGQSVLTILDWDITEIQASLLEGWLAGVLSRLKDYARMTCAQMGSLGAFIEDKAAGIVLLQQAANKGWAVHPIDSKLTSLGKDARAINASSYFAQNMVKITPAAFNKTLPYKSVSRNHLIGQCVEYRVNTPDSNREDDSFDTVMYGVAISLGNSAGF